MTGSRAPEDPSVRSFSATVDRVTDDAVVLDETYFYAASGGQPADRGFIDGTEVTDVRDVDGEVHHGVASPEDGLASTFEPGQEVECIVDDTFRTYCMRAHTASHVLYGAGRRLFDDLGYGGFDIDDRKVRVDFATPSDVDDEALVELERLTNRAVWDSLPVSWGEVDVETARDHESVAFNTKTEEGVMAGADTVRIVTVGGDTQGNLGDVDPEEAVEALALDGSAWDAAACGGTHVSNTAEIGPVEVLSRSNPGEGLTRIEFAVGPVGIQRDATVHRAALSAAREVDVGVEELPEAVARLADENEELSAELESLKGDVLDARLSSLETIDRDGDRWRIGAVDGFGPNEVGDRLQARITGGDDAPDVAAVVGDGDAPFVVVATDGTPAAGDVVEEITDRFGGGGGGGPTFAQGGGLDADPEDVLAWLRGE
ncbi:alanine--tRNA ligase-related protein [Halalkaliarchaeum sp. AArc-GB]|uniref:alanine--tRNA ligase-related protein n=1 Tax=Halalkaliarchaeum sp. AArc-GB TaxID=3074078 RepID=UPI0028642FC3|nr:alanine--tRNA ligase-related protein [Halalkaliarchaeum sp. AArc-GB]MDR5673179.1 alanine--tRNA ligase-related protein [Halalkaliarchaeum sp. AArc-GB]